MAAAKATADEVQNQVDAPDTENQNDTGIDLENTEVSFDDEADDGQAYKGKDSPDDEDEEEVEDSEDDGFDDEDDGDAEESDEEEQSDDNSDEEKKSDTEKPQQQMSEEERKEHNRKMAEARIAEREKALAQKATEVDQLQDKYVNEDGITPEEANRRAMEVELYNGLVDRNTTKLTTQADKAFADFPILASEDPAIVRRVARALDAFEAQHVTVDRLGNPTRVTGDLYTFLKDEADSINELKGQGARDQIKSKAKEKTKAFTTPSRKPAKKSSSDPMLEAFNEEANRYA